MGFRKPTTTPTPDEIFDVWLPKLTGAELKVLLYIVRRTFGFGKNADAISLSQITDGITKQNGEVLDEGTGLSRSTASKAVQSLEAKRLIKVERRKSKDDNHEINVYNLVFKEGTVPAKPYEDEGGVVRKSNYPSSKIELGVVRKSNQQETVQQETVVQETEYSNYAQNSKIKNSPNFSTDITRLVSDLSNQILHDPEHIKSNIAQAHNIWHRSGLSEEEFIQALYEAKQIALKRSAQIRKIANSETGLKNRAPYFFEVLRDLVLGKVPDKSLGLEPPDGKERLWREVLGEARLQMTRATFDAWLRDTKLISLDDQRAVVGVCDEYAKDWLEHRLFSTIQRTLVGIVGHDVEIKFELVPPASAPSPGGILNLKERG